MVVLDTINDKFQYGAQIEKIAQIPSESAQVFFFFEGLSMSECLLQQVSHLRRCLFLYLVRGMGIGSKGEPGAAVAQHAGHGLDINAVL